MGSKLLHEQAERAVADAFVLRKVDRLFFVSSVLEDALALSGGLWEAGMGASEMLDQVLPDRLVHHVDGIINAEFFHDVEAVGFNSPQAFSQRVGDLLVVFAIDYHSQYFLFSAGEMIGVIR